MHLANKSATILSVRHIFFSFFKGNVAIYSIYEPNDNKNGAQASYCNKILYLFAFWSTNIIYFLLGVAALCYFCFKQQHQGDAAQTAIPLQG